MFLENGGDVYTLFKEHAECFNPIFVSEPTA